jgi:NAD(P)H dehydrogenase (quinone)
MATNVLVVFYSAFGHIHTMAQEVEKGAQEVSGTEVRVRRVAEFDAARQAMSGMDAYNQAQEKQKDIPEVSMDDMRWADGVVWGTPTRFGNMIAQMKQFLDTCGELWMNGEMEDKATGIFTSTGTVHGGQESTLLTSLVPMLHLGMVYVGSPYGQNPEQMEHKVTGGSPYGPSTVAGGDGSAQPTEGDLSMARKLGGRVAKVAGQLKALRS